MSGLPGICQNCRLPVVWSSGAWRVPGSRGKIHRCAPVCGKPMPLARENCARRPGHLRECRTRYALDNNYRTNTGRDRLFA